MKKSDILIKNIGIKPLGDRVLVKEYKGDKERETKSGIILPETINEDKGAKRGEVVALGGGRYEDGKIIPLEVKIGDGVLFQWGDMIKIDGEEYFILSESNILAIIK